MVTITSSQLRPLLLSTLVIACLLYLYAFPLNWSSGSTKSAHVDQSASSAEQVVVVSEPHPNLPDPSLPPAWHNTTRANAAFVILTRNKELDDVRWTMRQLEARFNKKFNYPYVFLNDEPFTDEFKELTRGMTNAKIQYGIIPHGHWSYPEWIDVDKATALREQMGREGVIYGDSLSYRHMCRFESGFFFRHPLMLEYDYYWRVEPSVDFYCDIDYDPFLYMKENKMKYGWTISLFEYESTVRTLWPTVKNFMKEYPDLIPENNLIDFVTNDGGDTYNMCHFWSNFEIADLNWLRGPAYLRYFEYLDRAGGFFYERWGDAPVHSIAAAIFLNKTEVHFFDDIGYRHNPFTHCPTRRELQKKCHCNADDNFDYSAYSCMRRWEDVTRD